MFPITTRKTQVVATSIYQPKKENRTKTQTKNNHPFTYWSKTQSRSNQYKMSQSSRGGKSPKKYYLHNRSTSLSSFSTGSQPSRHTDSPTSKPAAADVESPNNEMLKSPKKRALPCQYLTEDILESPTARYLNYNRFPVLVFAGLMLLLWISCLSTVILRFHTSQGPLSLWWQSSTNDAPTVQQLGPRSLSAPLIRGSLSHSIPLPLPKQKVSVVLMNFSRPRMIRESTMMRTLLSHPNVDEVLLLHSNPKTAFEFVHPKVVNVDAIEHNDEMGLSLRFYFCQLAKNPWVLHLDDDMEFTTEALNELFIEYGRNPHRIVGRFGRDLTPGNSFNGYNSKNGHKSTEVILTKLMVMERETCSAFFEYAHLVWNDVILHESEGPLWNGEDIFMSLVANHVYGKPADGREYNNYAMDWLNVWQADDSLKDYDNGKLDISGGMRGYRVWDWRWWQTLLRRNRHYAYRGRLWQTARQRLSELDAPAASS